MDLMALIWLLVIAPVDEKAAITTVLNDFHQAAAVADRTRYFGCLSEDAVFLGTDSSERWTKSEFEAKYGPYMDAGKGWTYIPVRQNVNISVDGKVAWFDEELHNQPYGICRGSGILVKHKDRWLIAQYNLSIPIPNELAKEFVARIRESTKKTN